MKKLLLIPLISILFACSTNSTMSVNEPLTYDVKIKDNAEFILVKEGTSVEDFTNELPNYLDIETNADSYEIDWVGESLSTYTREEMQALDGLQTYQLSGMQKSDDLYSVPEEFTIDIENEIQVSKESTLNYDSFRPIELIIDFTKDGETKTYYKQITLAVARDNEYNVISSNNINTIEEAYRQIGVTDGIIYDLYDFRYSYSSSASDGYLSNIRQK